MSTLGGARVIKVEAHVPPSGAWYASGLLDVTTLPALGATSLVVGDLVLVGSIIRADYDDHPGGALVAFVARGGAGWRLPVTRAGSYSTSGGVRLSTVLSDLSAMTSEPYAAPSDVSLGTAYSWQAHDPLAPVHGADVLADLVARGYLPTWRVEPFTGLTRFDAWPSIGSADGRGRITERARARGRRTVGLDTQVAPFMPGATLESLVIRRLVLRETASALLAEVYDQ